METVSNRMIVEIYKNPFKKESKIIGAKNDVEEGYFFAKVLSVGDEVTKFQEGSMIYFPKMAGIPIMYYGKQFVVIREHDVIVKFSPVDEQVTKEEASKVEINKIHKA